MLENTKLDVSCFTADFWEDKVFVGGKYFTVGQFVVELLNLDADTVALTRMSVRNMRLVLEQIEQGYIYPRDFNRAKEEFSDCLNLMKIIPPLSLLDMEYEKFRIKRLMDEHQFEKLQRYFLLKSKLSENNLLDAHDWVKPTEKEKRLLSEGEFIYKDLRGTLRFYTSLGADIMNMILFARGFIAELSALKKLDETHLIKKLTELSPYGFSNLNIDDEKRGSLRSLRSGIEYAAISNPKKKSQMITARRMVFERFLDFLIADLFEGVCYGHFPQQCANCKRYFLMTAAYHRKYCNGIDPNDPKKRSCRAVASYNNTRLRELAPNNPIKRVCDKRLATLRTHCLRGKITIEQKEAAKQIAQTRRDMALKNNHYANTLYEQEMTVEAI